MSVYKIVFSPTGGTRKVLDIFAKEIGEIEKVIDLTEPEFDFGKIHFTEEDICIVAVPSYGGRVPKTAEARLSRLTGNGARAVLIAVYGNRAFEDTLVELEDILKVGDFRCVAGVAAVAEHSIMHQFAAGRPNVDDEKKLQDFAVKVKEKLENKKCQELFNLPGNRPYKPYGAVPMQIEVDNSCGNCGLCALKCPTGAISVDNPAEMDGEKCISCMRCVSICPKHERRVNERQLEMIVQKVQDVCQKYKECEWYC